MNYPNSYLRAYSATAAAYSDAIALGDEATAAVLFEAANLLWDLTRTSPEGE